MARTYSRPHLPFASQVALLKKRGLGITDDERAMRWLSQLGYQRLKPYWFNFRQPGPDEGKLETFNPGSALSDAVELYLADKALRLVFLDALERIEVSVRVKVSHVLGKRDPFAHRSTRFLDPSRSKQIAAPSKQTRHRKWLAHADRSERRSKSDWVLDYKATYGWPLPIWMAVEMWDFGTLSHLFELAHPSDRQKVAAQYELQDSELFLSWLRCLSTVRNTCAHHSRLWNEPLVNQPKVPKANQIPALAHMKAGESTQTRLYGAAAITQFLLSQICPRSTWKSRLSDAMDRFASIPNVSIEDAGFETNWFKHRLWN